ncbi:MAG: DNA-binding beta-propeller fold protein YncE [Saprospiraceae bacterium]|jgi:DNA-binding beta-propeller fold protein YncE
MQRITVFFLFISLLLFQIACSDDELGTGDDCPAPTETFETGVFVINEGNFQNGAGTVSFIGENDTESTNFVYEGANCDDILGSVVQSISEIDDEFYVVVNNSHKVVVVNNKMNKIGQVDELRFPRYLLKVDDNTAYITQWTNEVKGSVAVVNLTNLEIEQRIPAGTGPEGLIAYQGKIYVANGGGLEEEFGDSTVSIINPMTHEVEKTLQVGNNPNGFQIDKNGDLWVSCFGFQNSVIPNDLLNKNGSMARIKEETVQEIIEFDNLGINRLQINTNRDQLYFLYGGNPFAPIYTFDVDTKLLSTNPFINVLAYGLGVHPATGHIFVADAKSFVETGEVLEYDENGVLLQSFFTSIGPNGFLFLE